MDAEKARKVSYEHTLRAVIKALERRGMKGSYFESRKEVFAYLTDFLDPEMTVAFGGSVTLEEIGLVGYLRENQKGLIDRSRAESYEELRRFYSKAMLSDVFFSSSNAITLKGELVNIDGNGNRVGAMIYGPKKVVIVAGRNKIVSTVEEGIHRIRNNAAPSNAWRLDYETGCRHAGYCTDCMTPECMCGQIVITRFSRIPDRIEVILVNEDLGY